MNKTALEAAAKAYYAVRPLHHVFKNGASTPVPWEKMIAFDADSERGKSIDLHRKAVAAAIQAYLSSPAE